jgi:putative flippase GtrA
MHALPSHQAQCGFVDAGVQSEVIDAQADCPRVAMLARNMTRHAARRRLACFVAIGCCAAAVHWGVVVWLVSQWSWRPLVANVLGWLVAFVVSFAGHHLLTFRNHGAALRSAAGRFFVVSACGFAVNEASYALLLGWTGQRYDRVLALVLAAVAVLTYLLSRHWAFLRRPAR